MSNDRIALALANLFEKQRIVFWYDSEQEFRSVFDTLLLPNVEKLILENNEYGIKYRILREQPEQKFLLYREGPQPDDLDNWLLDVQLSNGEFRTDQVAIWLAELELGLEFVELVREHINFFQAAKRREELKACLKPDDTARQIRLKMLAVCSGSEARIDSILEHLLQEAAENSDDKFKLLERCELTDFLWELLNRNYGYSCEAPIIRDFVIELFKSCYAMGTDGTTKLTPDALVFLKRWKDSRQFADGFETLSAECASVLDIESDLAGRNFRELIELDYFYLIDLKIISDLVREVANRTVSSGDVTLWVRQRRQSHWYDTHHHLYAAIEYAARFSSTLDTAKLDMNDLSEAVQLYSGSWFKLDQLYRKFIYHVRMSGQSSLMDVLTEQIENLYTNNYLLKLGDRFQTLVDSASQWHATPIRSQNQFFNHWVKPFLQREHRVIVIISDAMRYEIGDELLRHVRREDRYSAELEPMLSMLPSYTQLGMAALLPNQQLSLTDTSSATVLVDGQSSQGTANRTKILSAALNGRGEAMTAEDFMRLNRDDSREVLKRNDVLYIYHNRIDHTGDKIHTEGEAFKAAEESLNDLTRLVKKLAGANANNILVTADHGFIYQDRELEESDFASTDVSGEAIYYRDRRFVLGKGLQPSPSLHSFSSTQLGLSGDVEVQIPKSINRLRLKGSGSRFVHGGATLQEVVVPVLKINKARQSDTSEVEVEIIRGSTSVITSGQLAVALYQTEPVTEKVQARNLRAGIYTQSGELISDCHEITFDLSSEHPREREIQVRFVLTKESDKANQQEVILRLEERHADTSHYREYKSARYVLRRSFTSDFDF